MSRSSGDQRGGHRSAGVNHTGRRRCGRKDVARRQWLKAMRRGGEARHRHQGLWDMT